MLDSTLEAALRELAPARSALDSLERSLVVRARLEGETWSELGAALGMTKQGVRKRHLAVDPIHARRPRRAETLAELHAELFAAAAGTRRSDA